MLKKYQSTFGHCHWGICGKLMVDKWKEISLYLQEMPENHKFSELFRGDRNGTLGEKGLNKW